jgi:UDP-glucose 4-epimerase
MPDLPNTCVGIAGGSGFIGSQLARQLSEVFDIVQLDIESPKLERQRARMFRTCDIRDYSEVTRSFKALDLVIHAAIIQIPTINEHKRLAYGVNILGTQNVCMAVDQLPRIKGMILCGSWHTIGERDLRGTINEEYGLRPDKVDERARLYAISKMGQESIVRFHDEMSEKVYCIVRMGTVLGEGMPDKTAASIFIENGLSGKPLTPFKRSMFRPMLYVDIADVCRAYRALAEKIMDGHVEKKDNSLDHVFNVFYPEPVTILELAEIVRDSIAGQSGGKIEPRIEIIDRGEPSVFGAEDKTLMKVDVSKAVNFLHLGRMKSPREAIDDIVRARLAAKSVV